jgi:dTDP-4-dehydrorhamnose reductase
MNVLVTGSSGLLGSTLCSYFAQQGEQVITLDRNVFSWASHDENIKNLRGIDCIIHAAANTDAEACELDPAKCYKDNTLFTERLSYAAGIANCKLVYVSSTGIYGTGQSFNPYTEYDNVRPTTHHHQSKWLGENAVNKYIKNPIIVRTGWIFGGHINNPKNFVARRIEEALNARNKQIYSNIEQRGVPTSVHDFSSRLYELIKNCEVGTFNLVNSGSATRFEYVSKIIEFANLDVEVLQISANSFNRIAKVSNNETAIPLKMVQIGYEPLPDWTESLESYIKSDLKDWISNKKLYEKS